MAPHFSTETTHLLRVHVDPDRDWAVVTPEGELDMATVPLLAQAVADLRTAGFDALRIDLRRLSFLDSSGLRYLLALSAEQSDGLRLKVIPGGPAIQRLFELTATEDIIPFERTGHAGAADLSWTTPWSRSSC